MTTELVMELTSVDIAEMVNDRVIQDGLQPYQAAILVLDELLRSGQAAAALRALGPNAIYEVWQQMNRKVRVVDIKGREGARGRDQRRVIDLTPLIDEPKTLLDGLYEIEGVWMSLGDLGKKHCHTLAQKYRRQVAVYGQNAAFFQRLFALLGDDEVIRQRFDEAALLKLYEEAA